MGFFDKLFGKKGENNDLMKILQQNQMSISTSINYQFACIYLRNISFSVDVFDKIIKIMKILQNGSQRHLTL